MSISNKNFNYLMLYFLIIMLVVLVSGCIKKEKFSININLDNTNLIKNDYGYYYIDEYGNTKELIILNQGSLCIIESILKNTDGVTCISIYNMEKKGHYILFVKDNIIKYKSTRSKLPFLVKWIDNEKIQVILVYYDSEQNKNKEKRVTYKNPF